jgi:hypothetical protein
MSAGSVPVCPFRPVGFPASAVCRGVFWHSLVRQYGFYSSTNNNAEHKNVMSPAAKRATEPI